MYRRNKPKICVPLNVVYINSKGKLASLQTNYNTTDVDPHTMKLKTSTRELFVYDESSSGESEDIVVEKSTTMMTTQFITLMNKLVDEGKTYDDALSTIQLMVRDRRDKRKIINNVVANTTNLKSVPSPIPEPLPDPIPVEKEPKKKKIAKKKKIEKKTTRKAATAAKGKRTKRRVTFAK